MTSSRSRPHRLAIAAALAASASIGPSPARSQGEPPAAGDRVERMAWLARAVDAELERAGASLGGARIGVAVREVATGRLLYAHDGEVAFNLASNTKLVTAAAALAGLGPGFTWRTGLYAAKVAPGGVVEGDLFVRGRGNPRLGTSGLDELARDLADLGITRISGGVAIDSTYFDGVDTPPHFDEQPAEQAYFRAPVAATSLNFDAIDVVVRPSPTGAGAARVSIEPASSYTTLVEEVATVGRGRSRVRVESATVDGHLAVTVRGQIRVDDRPLHIRRRVPDPRAYLVAVLRARLAARGVAVEGPRARLARVPDGAVLLAEHESEPLAVVVRDLGKHSNNYVAEMLLKTLGAETIARGQRPATWADGLAAVRGYLLETVGLAEGSYYVGNGSGLFQASRFSPDQLTRILVAAHNDFRFGPDLVSSLSIAGVDGTIGHRMAVGPAARRVRAKTGTLAGISTLAGFVAQDGGAPLAFAVLIGGAPAGRPGPPRAVQDAICEVLVHYLEADRRPTAPAAVPPARAISPRDAATAAE